MSDARWVKDFTKTHIHPRRWNAQTSSCQSLWCFNRPFKRGVDALWHILVYCIRWALTYSCHSCVSWNICQLHNLCISFSSIFFSLVCLLLLCGDTGLWWITHHFSNCCGFHRHRIFSVFITESRLNAS